MKKPGAHRTFVGAGLTLLLAALMTAGSVPAPALADGIGGEPPVTLNDTLPEATGEPRGVTVQTTDDTPRDWWLWLIDTDQSTDETADE